MALYSKPAFVHGNRVIHADGGAGLGQKVNEHKGGGFTHVFGLGLERESPPTKTSAGRPTPRPLCKEIALYI